MTDFFIYIFQGKITDNKINYDLEFIWHLKLGWQSVQVSSYLSIYLSIYLFLPLKDRLYVSTYFVFYPFKFSYNSFDLYMELI